MFPVGFHPRDCRLDFNCLVHTGPSRRSFAWRTATKRRGHSPLAHRFTPESLSPRCSHALHAAMVRAKTLIFISRDDISVAANRATVGSYVPVGLICQFTLLTRSTRRKRSWLKVRNRQGASSLRV